MNQDTPESLWSESTFEWIGGNRWELWHESGRWYAKLGDETPHQFHSMYARRLFLDALIADELGGKQARRIAAEKARHEADDHRPARQSPNGL